MSDTPVKMEDISGNRKVEIIYLDGEVETLEDNIYTSKKPHAKQKKMWTGKTVLELRTTNAKLKEDPMRQALSFEEHEVMITQYEQDVLRAVRRGAHESSPQDFEIHHTDLEPADLCEYAVPDTACRKTLVGEMILRGVEKRLNQKGFRVIRRHEVNEFRFGNAGTLISEEVAQIPIWLGERQVVVHAAVLPGSGSRTPFLFSKELLKQLECVLDMKRDLRGFHKLSETPIKLKRTARGHYAIPVLEAPGRQKKVPSDRRDDQPIGQGSDGGSDAGRDHPERLLCEQSPGRGERLFRGRGGMSPDGYRSLRSRQVQGQEELCPGVSRREKLCAVDSQPHHHQVLCRDEEASPLHRVPGQCEEGAPSDHVAGKEGNAAREGREEANANSAQGQEQEPLEGSRKSGDQRGSHSGGSRENPCQGEPLGKSSNSRPRRWRMDSPVRRGEWHGTGRGLEQRDHVRLGSSGNSQCTAEDQALQEQVSHSTDGSGNSRSLAPEEIEFLTGELERAWTGESNGREQVDVLIITPAQEANATVAEVFSVPRLCKLAEDAGLKSAGSYDILTGWDFRSSQKREELRDKLEIMRPRLLMLCPPCGASSPLQQFNKHHDLKNWLKQVSESRLFLRYSMQLARDQIRRVDLVVFEQPHGAVLVGGPS